MSLYIYQARKGKSLVSRPFNQHRKWWPFNKQEPVFKTKAKEVLRVTYLALYCRDVLSAEPWNIPPYRESAGFLKETSIWKTSIQGLSITHHSRWTKPTPWSLPVLLVVPPPLEQAKKQRKPDKLKNGKRHAPIELFSISHRTRKTVCVSCNEGVRRSLLSNRLVNDTPLEAVTEE